MSALYWIFLISLATLVACESADDGALVVPSAPVSDVNLTDTNSTPVEAAVVNSTSANRTSSSNNHDIKSSPSSWRLLMQKFFDRPSSQQKHADKNRIILENLAANQANPHSPSNTSAVAFHDEETVAVISYVDRNVESCKLMEVK